jgi:hypothetical protein
MGQQFGMRYPGEFRHQPRGLSIELLKLSALASPKQRHIHAAHSFKRSSAGAYFTAECLSN